MIGMTSCQRAQAVLYVVDPLINLSFETPMNDLVGRKGNNYKGMSVIKKKKNVELGVPEISHSVLFESLGLLRQVGVATSPRSCGPVERRDIPEPFLDQVNHRTLGMKKQLV
jgi:hypothetical protein